MFFNTAVKTPLKIHKQTNDVKVRVFTPSVLSFLIARNGEQHPFGNLRRMIAHTLKIFCYH